MKPVGHGGRCSDGQGRTWENNHPACPDCARHQTLVAEMRCELDRTRAELAALRAAIDVVHAAAPGEVERLRMEVEG